MRRSILGSVLGAVIAVGFAGLTFAANSTVKVRVTDDGGGVIAQARVLFHRDTAGQGVGLFEAEPPAEPGKHVQYSDALYSTDAKGQ
jgi:hypothetical protein